MKTFYVEIQQASNGYLVRSMEDGYLNESKTIHSNVNEAVGKVSELLSAMAPVFKAQEPPLIAATTTGVEFDV